MMWTSYAALCEMGFVTSSNPELDPVSIFGVIPSNLTKIPQSQGGYGDEVMTTKNDDQMDFVDSTYNNHHHHQQHENQEFLKKIREMSGESKSPFQITNASPIVPSSVRDHRHHTSVTNASYHNQSSFAPQTPYSRNFNMQDHHDNNDNSSLHATSLFPQTAISAASGISMTHGRGHLPSTTLFATPGLTPIPYDQPKRLSAKKDEVVLRAKQVASRLYYSPALTPAYYNQSMSNINTPGMNHESTRTPSSPGARIAPSSSMKTASRSQYKRRTDLLRSVDESKQGDFDFNQQRLLFDEMNDRSNRNLHEDIELTVDDEETEMEQSIVDNLMVDQENMTSHKATYKEEIESEMGEEAVQHILELFCTLGAAQRMLCSFHCKEAIQIYRSLPLHQYNTGFVQHQIGRAFFEMADYSNALRAFDTMQRVESYR